jgi:hypothetical protein
VTLFEKIRSKIKPKAKTACPNTPGVLAVQVLRSDTLSPIANAKVTARGPSPASDSTDDTGWVLFKDRKPGTYQADVALPPLLSKFRLQQATQSGAVGADDVGILEFEASPPPVLKVKVVSRREKGGKTVEEVLSDVEFEASGPAQHSGKSGQDWSTFRDAEPGNYLVAVKSLGARDKEYLKPGPVSAALALGETKEVVLVAPPAASLRIILIDREDVPIQYAEWTLGSEKGTTKLDGTIKIEKLPLVRGGGKLTVRYPKPKVPLKPAPAKPAAADPNKAPPYPPGIDWTEFADKDPARAADADPGTVEWTLKIGLLEDYADDVGVKDRLGNLGFKCSGSSDGEATTRAVKAYQRKHLKQPDGSGVLADVKGDLKSRHDNA